MGIRKTHEQFVEELKNINSDISVLSYYTSAKEKVDCSCNICDFKWRATPDNLLHGRHGCPQCAGNMKLTHETFVKEIFEKSPTLKILSQYSCSANKVDVECLVCGRIWSARAGHLLNGCGCIKCRPKTPQQITIIEENIKTKNPKITLLNNYTGKNNKIKCCCNICGYIWSSYPNILIKGKECPKCLKNKIKIKITKNHEEFVLEMLKINPNIKIESKYVKCHEKVKCRCLKDNYIWYATPSNLLRNRGCPVCSNKVIIKGLNDIATTNPELIEYFKNPEDSKCFGAGSSKRVKLICPVCNTEKEMEVRTLVKNGIRCNKCSDGISYPNKFARAFLSQLPIQNIIYEYSPKWANLYKYDNYFEYNNKSYILEIDGGFHYKDCKYSKKDDVLARDRLKDKMALLNNIIVIRIDCKKSNKVYISNNIMKSKLAEIFDLTNIDWRECEKLACSNILKIVCDYYNKNNNLSTIDISKKFQLNSGTIKKYLEIGSGFGFCSYSLERAENIRLGKLKEGKVHNKAVIVYDEKGNLLDIYKSIKKTSEELSKKYNLIFVPDIISKVCWKKQYSYHGLHFEFVYNLTAVKNNLTEDQANQLKTKLVALGISNMDIKKV